MENYSISDVVKLKEERDAAIRMQRRLEIYADDFLSLRDELKIAKETIKSLERELVPTIYQGSWKETAILKNIELRDLKKKYNKLSLEFDQNTTVTNALISRLNDFINIKQVNHIKTQAMRKYIRTEEDYPTIR